MWAAGQDSDGLRESRTHGSAPCPACRRVHPMPCGGWLYPNAPFAGQQQGQNRDWLPTVAVAPRPRPRASHLQTSALGSSQHCLTPLQTAFTNARSVPPNAAGQDAGGELCLPLPGSLSPAVFTRHPTSQATSFNTYSLRITPTLLISRSIIDLNHVKV